MPLFCCLKAEMPENVLLLDSDRNVLLLGENGISSIGSFVISGTSSRPINNPVIRATRNNMNTTIT